MYFYNLNTNNKTNSKITLITRYMVQSISNPMDTFVYESKYTLRIGETIFINSQAYIVLSRA